jgi:hypothetical protein
MKRVLLNLLVITMACSPVLVCISEAQAAARGTPSRTTKGKIDPNALREMLTKGLRVTRDDEKDYINYIVSLVAQDKLPPSLVYASFEYARKRRPNYPFPYFVFSVQTLAKRNKIEI